MGAMDCFGVHVVLNIYVKNGYQRLQTIKEVRMERILREQLDAAF
jgi:hypothetical protein